MHGVTDSLSYNGNKLFMQEGGRGAQEFPAQNLSVFPCGFGLVTVKWSVQEHTAGLHGDGGANAPK